MQALRPACSKPMARREQTPQAFFGRSRLMARAGTLLRTADTQDNEKAFGRSSKQDGKGAYPQLRGVLLAQCGTHAVAGLPLSRSEESELPGSPLLLCLLARDRLVLVDGGLIWAGVLQAGRERGGHVGASLPSGMWEKGDERIQLGDGSELGAHSLLPHHP
jgi:hypothetical protein